MTKEQIVQRLLKLNGDKPFASFNQVKRMTGLGASKCRDLVNGLDTVAGPQHGSLVTQLYFVDDVAQRIMEKGL
jgi:hypothetical protein